jgi:hypothetical protein
MSNGTFALALVVGAAFIALWLDVRAPRLAPKTLQRIALHAVLAWVLIELLPAGGSSVLHTWVVVFAAALPALVYSFLVAIWMIRLCQGALALGR